MNSSQSQKPASRWGTFLSNVESRLDTILAEEDPKAQQRPQIAKSNEQANGQDTASVCSDRVASPARSISSNRAQDRLNERLAKAIANKNVSKRHDTSRLSSEDVSRAVSPAVPGESGRNSEDVQPDVQAGAGLGPSQQYPGLLTPEASDETATEKPLYISAKDVKDSPASRPNSPATSTNEVPERSSEHHDIGKSELRSTMNPLLESRDQNPFGETSGTVVTSHSEPRLPALVSENETAEAKRQAETHELLEKIDALQAKLQYLTKEAAEAARAISAESKPGSLEYRLATKDEKIALLIEEGQKLSQGELKHMTVIKKLRTKAAEDERVLADVKRTSMKHEQSVLDTQERVKRAEIAERAAHERLKGLFNIEKDLEVVKNERHRSEVLISDLQKQLSELTSASKKAEDKARDESFHNAKKRIGALEDDLISLKAEKDFADKSHQAGVRDLREKLDREKERRRVADIERQAEASVVESRLEAYRVRAEEASAGQGGDIQAKLLRQVETLQNQYAVASENWQGIEGTLLTRLGLLEKERDEAAKREVDIRRKARESVRIHFVELLLCADSNQATRSRHVEEHLERALTKCQDSEAEQASLVALVGSLREQLSKAETEAHEAQRCLRSERESWESRHVQRMEDERSKIRDEFLRSAPTNIYTHLRNEPQYVQSRTRKSSIAAERSSPHSRRVSSYQGLIYGNADQSPQDRPLSRRSSAMVMTDTVDMKTSAPQFLNRTDSMSTLPNISLNNGIPETPSVDEVDLQLGGDDESLAGIHTPATPPERTINDLVSASTAAAGPSVQLVERMSATVRRLETEKTAHKDELARLAQQRDDARAQVVELLRDNEGKKAVDAQVARLESELSDLKKRHETTLEMLGEKSERVEELKADIVDLKVLLREMVEERVK